MSMAAAYFMMNTLSRHAHSNPHTVIVYIMPQKI